MQAMKPGVHLINVFRASLFDQEALREQLDNGHISRASHDVVKLGPLPANHRMHQHPRVCFSPPIIWDGPKIIEYLMASWIRLRVIR